MTVPPTVTVNASSELSVTFPDVSADTSGNVTESSDDALTVTVGGTVTQNGGTDSSGDAVDANGETATVGSAVTGLYGSLTINSDGSYSYVADNAEALDVGETVTDIFTFPVTDSCLLQEM